MEKTIEKFHLKEGDKVYVVSSNGKDNGVFHNFNEALGCAKKLNMNDIDKWYVEELQCVANGSELILERLWVHLVEDYL